MTGKNCIKLRWVSMNIPAQITLLQLNQQIQLISNQKNERHYCITKKLFNSEP